MLFNTTNINIQLRAKLAKRSKVPEIRADCSKNIPMARKCFTVIYFYHNICQLSIIVHHFELLEDATSMEGIHSTTKRTRSRSSIQSLRKLALFWWDNETRAKADISIYQEISCISCTEKMDSSFLSRVGENLKTQQQALGWFQGLWAIPPRTVLDANGHFLSFYQPPYNRLSCTSHICEYKQCFSINGLGHSRWVTSQFWLRHITPSAVAVENMGSWKWEGAVTGAGVKILDRLFSYLIHSAWLRNNPIYSAILSKAAGTGVTTMAHPAWWCSGYDIISRSIASIPVRPG